MVVEVVVGYGSLISWLKNDNFFFLDISGGTYDKFFTTATNPVHMEIAEMAKNEKYGWARDSKIIINLKKKFKRSCKMLGRG